MKTIYLVGICGTGMGNFAIMLKNKGYNVIGSDSGVYPPMSTQLINAGVKILDGYKLENVQNQKIDIAIIGNVIRRDNPEAQFIINSGSIEYYSMPEALHKFFFHDKESIVIAGTHGKTTTSFFASWMLENAGLKPGFFIGGIPKDFDVMGRPAEGKYFVIEGDEYDTVFYNKIAKFFFYNPKYLIINFIEFDHADIYKDLESIMEAFEKLVEMVPADGVIIYNKDDKNSCKAIKKAKCKTLSFGLKDKTADFYAKNIRIEPSTSMNFTVTVAGKDQEFKMSMPGDHNIMNALAVIALSQQLGVTLESAKHSVASFKGVKRRLDLYGVSGGRMIIDDFAHHPTAVYYTLKTAKEWFYPRKIWAIFEPRSATTRTNIMQKEFIEAFALSDNLFLAPVHQPERVEKEKRFDPDYVCATLCSRGVNAKNFTSVNAIVEELAQKTSSGDVILIMSNGGFDGIYTKLMNTFKDL